MMALTGSGGQNFMMVVGLLLCSVDGVTEPRESLFLRVRFVADAEELYTFQDLHLNKPMR